MRRIREVIQTWLRAMAAPVARRLADAGVSANQVTLVGFLVTAVGALLVGLDLPVAGGIVFVIGSLFDLLDGVLARERNQTSDFGAFLDSTLDRVGEALMFAALAYRFAVLEDPWLAALSVLAMAGAFLTSYARARAEGLGLSCSIGLITRGERVLILAVGLIGNMIGPAIWVLVLLGGFTAAQRIDYVRREIRAGVMDQD